VIAAADVFRLSERVNPGQPQSILFSRFTAPPSGALSEFWLGLDLPTGVGGRLLINGGEAARIGIDANDTAVSTPPANLTTPYLSRYFRLPASVLSSGPLDASGLATNHVALELYAAAAPGAVIPIQVRFEGFRTVDRVTALGSVWLPLDPSQYTDGVRAVVGGSADVRSLSDNYLTMRYRPQADPDGWSQWTEPQLAEGWIKRVLAGINPFNQRVTDLFNNSINTDVSLLTQAGQRWEGDIALNADSINTRGLIEI